MSKQISETLRKRLKAIYAEMMWLAQRRHVTSSQARSWYTHVRAEQMKRELRKFSGKVSKGAAGERDGSLLRLEHYHRIQTTLTQLVADHLVRGPDFDGFLKTVIRCENVHIVTVEENYRVMAAGGDYKKANVLLRRWSELPNKTRQFLWQRKLRGSVANAERFRP